MPDALAWIGHNEQSNEPASTGPIVYGMGTPYKYTSTCVINVIREPLGQPATIRQYIQRCTRYICLRMLP